MAAVAAIAEATTNNEEQLVTMIVDRQLFGIPILQVQDIVEAKKVTPVPLSTSAIAGMLNLRGRIVTVIDLRKLLGNDEEVPWESQMGVTVDYKGDLYTLLVDEIGDVRSVRRSDFDKAPSTLEPETRRLCSGIYRLQGSLLVVLEVSRILTREVIASAQMLTVAERKSRKALALEAAQSEEGGARQLSSRMTGLGDYDAESEAAKSDQLSDNIKQRKKENRNRRPVAERWREAMDERARQSGQTVYRMREPDEETLDAAREKMAEEEATWQGRVKGDATPVESGSGDIAGDLGELPDEAYSDEPLADLSFLDDSGSGDEPALTDSPPEEVATEEVVTDAPAFDEPIAGDEAVAPDFADIPADEITPVADESAIEPAADESAIEPAADESAIEDVPEPVVDEPVADFSPEMPVEEPAAADDVIEPADDTAADAEMPKAADTPVAESIGDDGKSSVLSGFWNKLRGPDKDARKPVSDEPQASDEAAIFDDMPASDEVPAADDEPKPAKKPAKSAGKAKSTAKKKAPAKRKSTKSDKS